jgi:hypothetical protein
MIRLIGVWEENSGTLKMGSKRSPLTSVNYYKKSPPNPPHLFC